MLRYFVAGNFWLFIAFACYVERLNGRFSPDTFPPPLFFSAICFLLYWQTSPSIAFRFSIRALLIVIAVFALVFALVVGVTKP
jgi:hypothetical protein